MPDDRHACLPNGGSRGPQLVQGRIFGCAGGRARLRDPAIPGIERFAASRRERQHLDARIDRPRIGDRQLKILDIRGLSSPTR